MLIPILGGIAALIAGVVGFASTKPNTFSVKRSTTIDAPPETVFGFINDFHRWGAWSPWDKLDPNMKREYSGEAEGVGAVYAWEGNKKAGKGRMEISESTVPSRVLINLDFEKPFASKTITEFNLTPTGGSTRIDWEIRGPNVLIGKVMGLFMNMDEMVGKDFERGLVALGSAAEKQGATRG